MFGALVMAVGVKDVFAQQSFTVTIIGYVIMRIAQISQWLRAAQSDPSCRKTCLRYAVGITFTQIGWTSLAIIPPALRPAGFAIMAFLELCVPVWAERVRPTNWHPHHIAERYGLLVIIVLGEGILGATNAIAPLFADHQNWSLLSFILGFSIITLVFMLWWVYFSIPWGKVLDDNRRSDIFRHQVPFVFGYGHFILFAALAIVGSSLELVADVIESSGLSGNMHGAETATHAVEAAGHSVSAFYAIATLTIAVTVFLVFLMLIRNRLFPTASNRATMLLTALLLPLLAPIGAALGISLPYVIWLLIPALVVLLNLCRPDHSED